MRRHLRGSSHKQRLVPSGGDTGLMPTSEGMHLQQPVRGQGSELQRGTHAGVAGDAVEGCRDDTAVCVADKTN